MKNAINFTFRPTTTAIRVRGNVCNNSKNVKSHVFLDLKNTKKRKNIKHLAQKCGHKKLFIWEQCVINAYIALGRFEAKMSTDIQQTWYFLCDFLWLFDTSFQKRKKSCFFEIWKTDWSVSDWKRFKTEDELVVCGILYYFITTPASISDRRSFGRIKMAFSGCTMADCSK